MASQPVCTKRKALTGRRGGEGRGGGGCLGLTGIRVFVKVDRLATSSWRKKD